MLYFPTSTNMPFHCMSHVCLHSQQRQTLKLSDGQNNRMWCLSLGGQNIGDGERCIAWGLKSVSQREISMVIGCAMSPTEVPTFFFSKFSKCDLGHEWPSLFESMARELCLPKPVWRSFHRMLRALTFIHKAIEISIFD